MKPYLCSVLIAGFAVIGTANFGASTRAQGAGPAGGAQAPARATPPPPDPTKPQKLEIREAKGRFKVQEQLAGLNFPSEAVGTTEAIVGTLVVGTDASFSPQSKLTVDLQTLRTDQDLRDNYIKTRTIEVDKFPMLEFVPKRAQGLPVPFPSAPPAQAGFQLIGDLTLHGVTKEVTWNVVATFTNETVAGRAWTTLMFSQFNMTKPTLARLLGVDDKINLEVEFKCKRSVVM